MHVSVQVMDDYSGFWMTDKPERLAVAFVKEVNTLRKNSGNGQGNFTNAGDAGEYHITALSSDSLHVKHCEPTGDGSSEFGGLVTAQSFARRYRWK